MKKFKNVGYIPRRRDSKYRGGDYDTAHFDVEFVTLDETDRFGNGTTLVELSWQSHMVDGVARQWYSPSIKFDPLSCKGNYWSGYDMGHKVLTFLTRHFGYSVSDELLRLLPDGDAIGEVKYEIKQGKGYGYGPHFNSLEPEVAIFIGFPALGIRRVIMDNRSKNHYIPVEDRMAEDVDIWQAKSPSGFYLGSTPANGVQEAKAKLLWDVIGAEASRIRKGGIPLEIVWPDDKQKYLDEFVKWQEGGMPVYCQNYGYPEVTDLEVLVDPSKRWHGQVRC